VQKLSFDGIYCWSEWQPDRNVFFNSYFVRRTGGNVAIDPLAWTADDEKQIEELGGVATIIVTNRDHERKARLLAESFGAKLAASEKDAPLLSGPVDRLLHDGEEAFAGARVIALDGLKSPGEIALALPDAEAAIVGDALWGDPAGSVRLLPDAKLLDPEAAVLSLRKLWALQLEVLLVGDGASIFGGADRIIGAYLQSRSGVFVNRINLDELPSREIDAAGDFAAACSEIGRLIGARKLGYQVTTLQPGKKFCPMHAHQLEEEMFFVLDGEPTIRTPRGKYVCRRGDVIAFPVGDAGTHQLLNESGKPCSVFLLGTSEPEEVALYPDSKKVWVRGRGLRLRTRPQLDYYDGET